MRRVRSVVSTTSTPIVAMASAMWSWPRARESRNLISRDPATVMTIPAAAAAQKPADGAMRATEYAPSASNEPWAKFTTRVPL